MKKPSIVTLHLQPVRTFEYSIGPDPGIPLQRVNTLAKEIACSKQVLVVTSLFNMQ